MVSFFLPRRERRDYTAPMSTSLATTVAMVFLASGVDVRSATNCPSSEAISARLRPLLASSGETEDVAWVELGRWQGQREDGTTAVRLRLVRSDASVVADRMLALQGGCEEMADTVATVLAAWETQPVAQPVMPVAEAGQPVPESSLPALAWWLGAAGGAGVVDGVVTTGGLELSAGREEARGWARMAAVAQTERKRSLAGGEVSWWRTHASLGIGLRSLGSPWRVAADAGMLLGWLFVSGQGFSPSDRQSVFELGVGAGLRLQRRLAAWAVWLDARANAWPQKQRAVLTGSQSGLHIPQADVLFTLGVSRLVFR